MNLVLQQHAIFPEYWLFCPPFHEAEGNETSFIIRHPPEGIPSLTTCEPMLGFVYQQIKIEEDEGGLYFTFEKWKFRPPSDTELKEGYYVFLLYQSPCFDAGWTIRIIPNIQTGVIEEYWSPDAENKTVAALSSR